MNQCLPPGGRRSSLVDPDRIRKIGLFKNSRDRNSHCVEQAALHDNEMIRTEIHVDGDKGIPRVPDLPIGRSSGGPFSPGPNQPRQEARAVGDGKIQKKVKGSPGKTCGEIQCGCPPLCASSPGKGQDPDPGKFLQGIAGSLVDDDGNPRVAIKALDFSDQRDKKDDIPQITGPDDADGEGQGHPPFREERTASQTVSTEREVMHWGSGHLFAKDWQG